VPSLVDRLSWIRKELRGTPMALTGHLLGMGIITGVLRDIDTQGPWHWWLLPCLCAWVGRWLLLERLGVWHGRMPAALLLRWERQDRALVLFQGAWTGAACGLYQPMASGLEQSTLMIVVFVCVVSAIPSLLGRVHLFASYAVVTVGPLAVAVLQDTADAERLHLVGSLVLLVALVVWMLAGHRALVGHLFRQRSLAQGLRLQLAEQAARAQAARLSAEQDSHAKSALIASAGHDIRQPLLALRLYALQLRAGLCGPREESILQAINCGLNSMETMIGDLLDVARAEVGAMAPQPTRVCMQDVYARLMPQVGPLALDKGLSLRWRGGHREVWGDAQMMERALRNLVLNAIEHTESGGVLVGARPQGSAVVLQVWDSGCGLDDEAQLRVFEDHYQVRPEHGRGCGLGLGIVRRLCHLMDAQVRLRSRRGCGTVFELRFRATAEEAGPEGRFQLGW
jgi:signal transduction histidine kinase